MTPHGAPPDLALLAAAVAGGILFGLGYFAALRRSAALYGADRGRLGAGALTLARLACAIGFFTLAARLGALPLLGALLGFLAARSSALRAARRDP